VCVVLALEIEPIGFRIGRGALRQVLLSLWGKLRAQPLRNFLRDIALYRQQVRQLAMVLLAPQLLAIANVIEFNIYSDVVATLSHAARENGLDVKLVANL